MEFLIITEENIKTVKKHLEEDVRECVILDAIKNKRLPVLVVVATIQNIDRNDYEAKAFEHDIFDKNVPVLSYSA